MCFSSLLRGTNEQNLLHYYFVSYADATLLTYGLLCHTTVLMVGSYFLNLCCDIQNLNVCRFHPQIFSSAPFLSMAFLASSSSILCVRGGLANCPPLSRLNAVQRCAPGQTEICGTAGPQFNSSKNRSKNLLKIR